MTAQGETHTVKMALNNGGFRNNNIRVKHGTGTASGWLKVYADIHHKPNCTCVFDGVNPATTCPECRDLERGIGRRILQLAQGATGRNGEYDGRINIYLSWAA